VAAAVEGFGILCILEERGSDRRWPSRSTAGVIVWAVRRLPPLLPRPTGDDSLRIV